MRLSDFEKKAIVNVILEFDSGAGIWLFGLCADDSKGGGDIDIAVLSSKIKRKEKHKIVYEIEKKIGEQKIDLVVSEQGDDPFFQVALESGIKLNG